MISQKTQFLEKSSEMTKTSIIKEHDSYRQKSSGQAITTAQKAQKQVPQRSKKAR